MSMIVINRTDSVISGSVNGVPFGVSFDEEKYARMKELEAKANSVDTMEELRKIVEEFEPLTKESYKELAETKSPYIVVNKHSNKFFLKFQSKVSSLPLPKVLVDKMIKSIEKGIDITPLVKLWARYIRPVPGRPAYSESQAALFAQYIDADYVNGDLVAQFQKDGLSSEVAQERGTTKQVAITQEGLLVGYKVSTEVDHKFILDEETEEIKLRSRFGKEVDEDTGEVTLKKPEFVEDRLFQPAVMQQRGEPFFCDAYVKPGHKIKVGCRHWLESWDSVGAPGGPGLHLGGARYIQGYQNYPNAVTHNVLIDPMHIHSVAGLGYGNDGAMTVKEYFVHSSFAGPNRNIYHSSRYAALNDAAFAKIVEEAVEATKMKQAEAQALLEETQDLIPVKPDDAAKVFIES